MKVLVATSNKGKIAEISQILFNTGITLVSPPELGMSLDVEENGMTFAENAIAKAVAWQKASGLPSLADDSGLCVDALEGKPGVLSARFAGPGATDQDNMDLLLRLMEDKEDRKARFVCVVALALSEQAVVTGKGEYEGSILRSPLGTGGFGYDPLFLDHDSGKTFAQLSNEEKNTRSHRGRALLSLRKKLLEQGLIP
jgi:XTP/dITP diphosphohydrolase